MFSAQENHASPLCMFVYQSAAIPQQSSSEQRMTLGAEVLPTKARTTRSPTVLTSSLGALVILNLHDNEAGNDLSRELPVTCQTRQVSVGNLRPVAFKSPGFGPQNSIIADRR